MSKTVLVTGATGFVGAHLVRRLASDGWRVHVVSRPASDADRLAPVQDKIRIHCHDGTTESLIEIFRQACPEVVFHLASLFIAEHQPGDVEPLIRSNVMFGVQLLEAMQQAGVTRLINAGTSWQHFENRDYGPVCLYAATKQAFETLLQFYCETARLRVVTLKLFDTYGPEDPRPKLFHLLDKVARAQKPFPMSPGDQLIDLVYIDDVVEAFVVAANHSELVQAGGHESYAVTSAAPVKLQELVALYCRVRGMVLPIEWGGRPYRAREVMVPWNSGEILPGWQPRVELAEGLARMLAQDS